MLKKLLTCLVGVAATLIIVACADDDAARANPPQSVRDSDRSSIPWDLDDPGLQIVTFTNADGDRCTVVGDKADGTDGPPTGSFALACDFGER